MLLIKGAEVYAPEYLGKKDVLIAGEKIERIGEDLPEYEGCQVIDGTGRRQGAEERRQKCGS